MKLCLLYNKNARVVFLIPYVPYILYLNPSKVNQCRINWTGDAAGSIDVIPFYSYPQSHRIKLSHPLSLTTPLFPFRNLPTQQSFSDHDIVWIYCLIRETPTFMTQIKARRNAQCLPTSFRASIFDIPTFFMYVARLAKILWWIQR